MPDVLVRNVDQTVLDRLKARASEQHRSLQAELQAILSQAATQASCEEIKDRAAELRTILGGREHTDSARLLAEDRSR
jgi:plasmid stability protein